MARRQLVTALILTLCIQGTASTAQDTELFGLQNQDLARLFLEEAIDIARSGSVTRDPFADNETKLEQLSEFQVLQEAYRADPEATLALIDRILKAGRTR